MSDAMIHTYMDWNGDGIGNEPIIHCEIGAGTCGSLCSGDGWGYGRYQWEYCRADMGYGDGSAASHFRDNGYMGDPNRFQSPT